MAESSSRIDELEVGLTFLLYTILFVKGKLVRPIAPKFMKEYPLKRFVRVSASKFPVVNLCVLKSMDLTT